MTRWFHRLRVWLMRHWLSWALRETNTWLTIQRDEVAYLETEYRLDPYNRDVHYALLHARDYVAALEERRDELEASLRELPLCS